MAHITITVETGPTANTDEAAEELISLANRLAVNVVTEWNGVSATARPGMTLDDFKQDHKMSVLTSQYPNQGARK